MANLPHHRSISALIFRNLEIGHLTALEPVKKIDIATLLLIATMCTPVYAAPVPNASVTPKSLVQYDLKPGDSAVLEKSFNPSVFNYNRWCVTDTELTVESVSYTDACLRRIFTFEFNKKVIYRVNDYLSGNVNLLPFTPAPRPKPTYRINFGFKDSGVGCSLMSTKYKVVLKNHTGGTADLRCQP